MERDQRKITIDEVKRNAIFNRQITANKAVANLLAIIQQLTANVNAAKADIIILEKNLAEAEAANNACNDEIFKLSNTRAKIQNAIKSRQDKIVEVNKIIEVEKPVNHFITQNNPVKVVVEKIVEVPRTVERIK